MALASALADLGSLCWRRSKTVLLLWVAAVVIAGSMVGRLPERLLSGSGEIAGSASFKVDKYLREDFGGGDAQSLILTFRSAGGSMNPAELQSLLGQLKSALEGQRAVATLTNEFQLPDGLRPRADGGHLILIELNTPNVLATEQQVPRIRAAIAPVFDAASQSYAPVEWAITGRAALTYDINRFNADDSARAEVRALPLTLVILIFAFGSIVAAVVPLALAIVTRTIALGAVFLIAGSFEVSNLIIGIVTMLALALGIDYSLFIIHRFRLELEGLEQQAVIDARSDEERAMRSAMAGSGTAVVYSAATVAIGMGALLVTPLMQTRSIGLGGMAAVSLALLAALTLLPAFIHILGRRILDWPPFLARLMNGDRSRRLWQRWADGVIRRPLAATAASLALISVLAAPALHTRFGIPESEFLPKELEYSRGLTMLEGMGLEGIISPVMVVLRDTAGDRALSPERAPDLARFVSRLEQDQRVRLVLGPVPSSLGAAASPSMNEAMGGALSRSAFVSESGNLLLFRIIPSNGSTLEDLQSLATQIPGWLDVEGLAADVGGQAQYYNDFDRAVGDAYPLTIALVLGVSAIALLVFFRAPLAAAKAILLNLLSVAAGYGVVVLVFQLGHGAELFGMPSGTGVVPITVPLVIFCILFGLSMDYEIFLLSRVRTNFLATGDTKRSIGEALADTGSVITSAALVMVAVFGAFAFSRVFIAQMIGLGLAVAVLVDATLIRSVLGPALMQVAGRWNWWPLYRSPQTGEGR
jgi:RND superfamily putative drug exporter